MQFIYLLLLQIIYICAFRSRSSDPPNTGNPNWRQNGSRLCEEAETTIRHDLNALNTDERKQEDRGDCVAIATRTCTLILRVNEKNRGEKGREESPSLRYIVDSHFLFLTHFTCLPIFLPAFIPKIRQIYFSVNRVEYNRCWFKKKKREKKEKKERARLKRLGRNISELFLCRRKDV